MNNDGKFSIKLANGNERTFESASEMANWIQDQREQRVPRSKKTGRNAERNSHRDSKRKVRCYSGDSPLARYANRNSDET